MAKGKNMKILVIILLTILVIVVFGSFAWFYFKIMGDDAGKEFGSEE
jgi:flagellar basal body-associated protein FliL